MGGEERGTGEGEWEKGKWKGEKLKKRVREKMMGKIRETE